MGSHFVRFLLESYNDVAVLNFDKLTYAADNSRLKDVVKHFADRYSFLHGDIADKALVEKVFTKFAPDIVVDFAAETHVDRSILNPGSFVKTDVIGTYILLEAARAFSAKRYIKASTDEVFGSISRGKFSEDSPFKPNSPYSASKAGGDLLCRAWAITYKTPVIVTHFCNFIGPWQHPEKFIPLFITNLLDNQKAPLYGNGRNEREWIYTADVCRALDLLIEKGEPGEVYNIGSGQLKENWEVATQIAQHLKKDSSYIVKVEDRPGHDLRYCVDWSKIKKLGFEPKYTFEKALKETIEWYKENRSWWEPIKKSSDFKGYYQKQYATLNPKP